MIVYELEQQIDEAISMVHDGKRLKRKKCYFVSEKQYRSLTAQEQAAAMAKEQLFDSQRRIMKHCIFTAASLAVAAAIFIAATVQGMMEPAFGSIVIVSCAAGAAGNAESDRSERAGKAYHRGKQNGSRPLRHFVPRRRYHKAYLL